MKILDNFDTGVNFWKANPTFSVAGIFKEIYTQDKSKDKVDSSRLMWTIALIWDMGSRLFDLPEDGPDSKIDLLFRDFYGDPEFPVKQKEVMENLKKTNEQITENIGKIKEEKKTVEFENWLNNLKKEATMLYNDGTSISFEDLYRANEWSKLKTELEELNFRETKATGFLIVLLFPCYVYILLLITFKRNR